MNDVLYEAHSWLADDPDPDTRAELRHVLQRAEDRDTEALADLGDRFAGFLTFGTAGLRGALGAGPNRMNRSVVIRAAAGLATYLNALREPVRGDRHRVVIGYDARRGSTTFAQDTAAVMVAAGVEAMLMPRELPTPVLAFAIRHLDADAGVMVTASHNPPQDNGYKVYLGGPDGGSQIVAPIDAEIASYIRDVHATGRVARARDGWTVLGEDLVDDYIASAVAVASGDGPHSGAASSGAASSGAASSDATASPVATAAPGIRDSAIPTQGSAPRQDLRIVLTSLHGVGGDTVVEALARAGFTDVHPVPEQAEPDPDFPTVAFPNPEEPGAMDLALALADRIGADVVLANDPDADRLAVALPVPAEHTPDQAGLDDTRPGQGATGTTRAASTSSADDIDSRWQMLHGDQVGVLLGEHIARKLAHATRSGHESHGEHDDAHGGNDDDASGDDSRSADNHTPTGAGTEAADPGNSDVRTGVFVNSVVSSRLLGRIAAAHGIRHVETLTGFKWISRVPGLVYGYEEALGYCVDPSSVRDKDGIAAAVLFAELAATTKAAGHTLWDVLDDLAREHGLHLTDQLSIRVDDAKLIGDAMRRLRRHPPTHLAGSPVVVAKDLHSGTDGLPPTNGLRYYTDDGSRVVVRPSGTEPKLKCYLEAVVDVSGGSVARARSNATVRIDALRTDIAAALGL